MLEVQTQSIPKLDRGIRWPEKDSDGRPIPMSPEVSGERKQVCLEIEDQSQRRGRSTKRVGGISGRRLARERGEERSNEMKREEQQNGFQRATAREREGGFRARVWM